MPLRVFGIRLGKEPEPEPERAPERSWTWWPSAGGGGGWGYTLGGFGDSYTQALKNAASWACIDVLVDAIARTPYAAVLKTVDGARIPVNPQPRILTDPSGLVTEDVWMAQLAWSLVTDGNAFGQVVAYSADQLPLQVEWLDPSTVTERKVENGRKRVKIDQEWYSCWPHGEIVHIPGRMIRAGSPYALSPIEWANANIRTSLAAEDYSGRWFTDGGHPTSIYRSDVPLTPDQISAFKQMVRLAESNREPVVMGSGIERETVQESPDAVTLSILQNEVVNVCRFWHVPPSWVYAAVSGQSVTYANLSQEELAGLKNTLDGYYVRVEKNMTRWLPGEQFIRANRNAVLRSDQSTRFQNYRIARLYKFMTVNEIRALEDMPAFGEEWDDPIGPVMDAGEEPASD